MKQIQKTLILLCFVISMQSMAQSYANAFTANIGIVQDGIGGLFNYNYFIDRHDFIEAGIFITAANYKYQPSIKIPYNDFTINAGYSKNVFYNYQNTLNVNIGAGGVFGYETINKGEKNLSDGALIISKPGFIYGAFLGLDIDYSISDQLSVVLKANQFYHANSTLGEFVPFIGIGLKYYTD